MDVRLGALADAQDRVVSRAQLRGVGVDRWAVRHRVASGRWQAEGSRVIVLHNGALTRRQRWWAAVLHAGPGASLAGRTAAEAHGLARMDDGRVHVLTRTGRNIPALPGVRMHESRHAGEIDAVGCPPRQRPAHALVSAAGWSPRPEVAAGILAAGVQQRVVRPESLRGALAAAGPIRHAALLRRVIADLEGGAESFAEIDAVRLARSAGIPAPRQQSVRVIAGRRRYLDAAFDGWSMEIDGAVHLEAARHADDLLRHDDLTLAGDRILRFAALTVRTRPDQVVLRMRHAHAQWARSA